MKKKKPSFHARWLNRRIWRWRWNKVKHNIHLLTSKQFRQEMREYKAWLDKEKAEAQVLIDSLPEHSLDTCAISQKPDWFVCPSGYKMHGEGKGEHWWSGWPGAFCLKCFAEDLSELCIGGVCECSCHEEFWKDYAENG